MTSAIVNRSFLNGEITPIGFEQIALRMIIFLSFKKGGVVGNCPNTKKIEEIIDGLNQLGANILFDKDTADIFEIIEQKKTVNLKGSATASRFLLPFGFFLNDEITFENVNLPNFAKRALFDYAQQTNVRLFQMGNKIKIDGKNRQKEHLGFNDIEGSFWAGSFILAASATQTKFLVMVDDYVVTHPSISHTFSTLDILRYEYAFSQKTKVFCSAIKNWAFEPELEIPPNTRFASYYISSFLLSGKGKVKCNKLSYNEIALLKDIAKDNIEIKTDWVEVKEPLKEIEFPSEIAPQSFHYFLPLLFVMCTKAKKTTKIGPFFPYRKKKIEELKFYAKKLNEIGAKIEYVEPYFQITPSKLYGGVVEVDDPYQAMALTITGLICQSSLKVKNIGKILNLNKNFFDDLISCDAKIDL